MTNEELSDYLHKIVKIMSLEKEEESDILNYIQHILNKTESYYDFIGKDKNKENIINFLEKLPEVKNG